MKPIVIEFLDEPYLQVSTKDALLVCIERVDPVWTSEGMATPPQFVEVASERIDHLIAALEKAKQALADDVDRMK